MTHEQSKPGEDYNERGDILALLTAHGARYIYSRGGIDYLCRPGKTSGVSATLNFGGGGCLYVFTSNWPPFEPKEFYSKFAVFAMLECNGNFKSAAKKLAELGYGGGDAVAPRPQYAAKPKQPERYKAAARRGAIYGNDGARIYTYSINRQIINKPAEFDKTKADFFEKVTTDLPGLLENVARGYAVSHAALRTAKRNGANFLQAELLIIDIDNCGDKDADGQKQRIEAGRYLSLQDAMTLPIIRDYAAAVWTTPSHTTEWHRYRALFPLPDIFDNPADFDRLLKSFAKKVLPFADTACWDIVRLFYGNTRGVFWLNDGGEFRKINPLAPTEPIQPAYPAESEYSDISELLRYFEGVTSFPKIVKLPDGYELQNVGMFVRQTLWAMQGETSVPVALQPNVEHLHALRNFMERGAQ